MSQPVKASQEEVRWFLRTGTLFLAVGSDSEGGGARKFAPQEGTVTWGRFLCPLSRGVFRTTTTHAEFAA